MTNPTRTPDFLPVLSPGRHRNPRKGACFMEMASYLAGERWSDHPRCTHPLVAAMAREINDRLGDGARQQLAPMIPDVVGLNGDSPRIVPAVAREAAMTALPVVSMTSQRAAAVGLLRAEAELATLDERPVGSLSPEAQRVLSDVPDAERWARHFISASNGRRDSFARRGANAVVHHAVSGISRAAVPHPDQILVDLLRRTIDLVDALAPRLGTEPVVPAPEPRARRRFPAL